MPVRSDPATPRGALSFGARMRHERERRKISIASIAETTKILGALLEGLERNDLSRWPTGFYRRAFMRAYASAIGLDPDTTVKEFLEAFPDPEAVAGAPGASSTASDRHHALPGEPASGMDLRMSLAGIRVGAPRPGTWFSAGSLVPGVRLRCLAAAVDLFVLSVMGVALYAVIGSFWAPVCGAAALYYSGSILLLGNTPGVCLFAEAWNSRMTPKTRRGRPTRRGFGELLAPVRDRLFAAITGTPTTRRIEPGSSLQDHEDPGFSHG
jgi:hypothetical protein